MRGFQDNERAVVMPNARPPDASTSRISPAAQQMLKQLLAKRVTELAAGAPPNTGGIGAQQQIAQPQVVQQQAPPVGNAYLEVGDPYSNPASTFRLPNNYSDSLAAANEQSALASQANTAQALEERRRGTPTMPADVAAAHNLPTTDIGTVANMYGATKPGPAQPPGPTPEMAWKIWENSTERKSITDPMALNEADKAFIAKINPNLNLPTGLEAGMQVHDNPTYTHEQAWDQWMNSPARQFIAPADLAAADTAMHVSIFGTEQGTGLVEQAMDTAGAVMNKITNFDVTIPGSVFAPKMPGPGYTEPSPVGDVTINNPGGYVMEKAGMPARQVELMEAGNAYYMATHGGELPTWYKVLDKAKEGFMFNPLFQASEQFGGENITQHFENMISLTDYLQNTPSALPEVKRIYEEAEAAGKDGNTAVAEWWTEKQGVLTSLLRSIVMDPLNVFPVVGKGGKLLSDVAIARTVEEGAELSNLTKAMGTVGHTLEVVGDPLKDLVDGTNKWAMAKRDAVAGDLFKPGATAEREIAREDWTVADQALNQVEDPSTIVDEGIDAAQAEIDAAAATTATERAAAATKAKDEATARLPKMSDKAIADEKYDLVQKSVADPSDQATLDRINELTTEQERRKAVVAGDQKLRDMYKADKERTDAAAAAQKASDDQIAAEEKAARIAEEKAAKAKADAEEKANKLSESMNRELNTVQQQHEVEMKRIADKEKSAIDNTYATTTDLNKRDVQVKKWAQRAKDERINANAATDKRIVTLAEKYGLDTEEIKPFVKGLTDEAPTYKPDIVDEQQAIPTAPATLPDTAESQVVRDMLAANPDLKASEIQRRLQVGYNQASDLLDNAKGAATPAPAAAPVVSHMPSRELHFDVHELQRDGTTKPRTVSSFDPTYVTSKADSDNNVAKLVAEKYGPENPEAAQQFWPQYENIVDDYLQSDTKIRNSLVQRSIDTDKPVQLEDANRAIGHMDARAQIDSLFELHFGERPPKSKYFRMHDKGGKMVNTPRSWVEHAVYGDTPELRRAAVEKIRNAKSPILTTRTNAQIADWAEHRAQILWDDVPLHGAPPAAPATRVADDAAEAATEAAPTTAAPSASEVTDLPPDTRREVLQEIEEARGSFHYLLTTGEDFTEISNKVDGMVADIKAKFNLTDEQADDVYARIMDPSGPMDEPLTDADLSDSEAFTRDAEPAMDPLDRMEELSQQLEALHDHANTPPEPRNRAEAWAREAENADPLVEGPMPGVSDDPVPVSPRVEQGVGEAIPPRPEPEYTGRASVPEKTDLVTNEDGVFRTTAPADRHPDLAEFDTTMDELINEARGYETKPTKRIRRGESGRKQQMEQALFGEEGPAFIKGEGENAKRIPQDTAANARSRLHSAAAHDPVLKAQLDYLRVERDRLYGDVNLTPEQRLIRSRGLGIVYNPVTEFHNAVDSVKAGLGRMVDSIGTNAPVTTLNEAADITIPRHVRESVRLENKAKLELLPQKQVDALTKEVSITVGRGTNKQVIQTNMYDRIWDHFGPENDRLIKRLSTGKISVSEYEEAALRGWERSKFVTEKEFSQLWNAPIDRGDLAKAKRIARKTYNKPREYMLYNVATGVKASIQDAASNAIRAMTSGEGGALGKFGDLFKMVADDSEIDSIMELGAMSRVRNTGGKVSSDMHPGAYLGRAEEVSSKVAKDGSKWGYLNPLSNKGIKWIRGGQDNTFRWAIFTNHYDSHLDESKAAFFNFIRGKGGPDVDAILGDLRKLGDFNAQQVRDITRSYGIRDDSYARTWAKEVDDLSREAGDAQRRIMFDFKKTKADDMVSKVFLFHMFMTRSTAHYARLMVQHPWMLAYEMKLWQAANENMDKFPGAPDWMRGFIGFGIDGNHVLFTNPMALASISGIMSSIGDPGNAKSSLGKALNMTGLVLNPIINAGFAVLGMENLQDATGTLQLRRAIFSGYDSLKASDWGRAHGMPQKPTEDFIMNVQQAIVDHVNEQFRKVMPTLNDYDQATSGQIKSNQVKGVLTSNFVDQYGPQTSKWPEGVEDRYMAAIAALENGTANPDLEDAFDEWAHMQIQQTGGNAVMPTGAFIRDNSTDTRMMETREAKNKPPEQRTPDEQGLVDINSVENKGSPVAAQLEETNQDYKALGTTTQQALVEQWNLIAGGDLPPRMIEVIGGVTYTSDQVNKMTRQERMDLADQWVADQENPVSDATTPVTDPTGQYADLRGQQKEVKAEDPVYGDFKSYQSWIMGEDGGGTRQLRQELYNHGGEYKKAEDNQRKRLQDQGLSAEEIETKLDSWASSQEAYLAVIGERSWQGEGSMEPPTDFPVGGVPWRQEKSSGGSSGGSTDKPAKGPNIGTGDIDLDKVSAPKAKELLATDSITAKDLKYMVEKGTITEDIVMDWIHDGTLLNGDLYGMAATTNLPASDIKFLVEDGYIRRSDVIKLIFGADPAFVEEVRSKNRQRKQHREAKDDDSKKREEGATKTGPAYQTMLQKYLLAPPRY